MQKFQLRRVRQTLQRKRKQPVKQNLRPKADREREHQVVKQHDNHEAGALSTETAAHGDGAGAAVRDEPRLWPASDPPSRPPQRTCQLDFDTHPMDLIIAIKKNDQIITEIKKLRLRVLDFRISVYPRGIYTPWEAATGFFSPCFRQGWLCNLLRFRSECVSLGFARGSQSQSKIRKRRCETEHVRSFSSVGVRAPGWTATRSKVKGQWAIGRNPTMETRLASAPASPEKHSLWWTVTTTRQFLYETYCQTSTGSSLRNLKLNRKTESIPCTTSRRKSGPSTCRSWTIL